MIGKHLTAALAFLLLIGAAPDARAACEGIVDWEKVSGQTMKISRPVDDEFDKGEIQLTTYLYRPGRSEDMPALIYNHGSTGPGVVPVKQRMYPSCEIIRFFTDHGYLVVAPNRRGRGDSNGTYTEECLGCSTMQYYGAGVRGLTDALQDLDAVISEVAKLSFVDGRRIILAGQSRGGFLSVIYAGRRPDIIRGVVNFSGGWFGVTESRSREFGEFNYANYRDAGGKAKAPMLWLYRENDRYYAPRFIHQFHESFRSGGGKANLHIYPNDTGRDGHGFTSQPTLWTAHVAEFLAALK